MTCHEVKTQDKRKKKEEEIKGRNKVEWIRMELSDIEYSRLVI